MGEKKINNRRAVFVSPLPPPYGGIANWTKLIVDGFAKYSNWQVAVVDTAPAKRATEGRTFANRVFGGVLSIVRTIYLLGKYFAKHSAAVVHISTSGSLALFRDAAVLHYLTKHNVPVVCHLHFGRVPEILKNGSWEKSLLLKNLKRYSRVIAIDGSTAMLLGSLLGDEKVKFVENPIDLDALGETVRGCNCEKHTVVFVGWVVSSKGVAELGLAWSEVHASHPDWRLRLIGPFDSCMEKSLLEICGEGMDLVGELPHDEAMMELAQSSIAVLPSHTEGFPYFVLEAMSLGKPVIGTHVGAIPDMLDKDRGIIVPPGDVSALKCAIERLINNAELRHEMGKASAEYAREHCSLAEVVHKYEEVWIESITCASK